MYLGRKLVKVDFAEQLFNGLCAHHGLEIVLVFFLHVLILLFVQKLFLDKGGVAGVANDILGEIKHVFKELWGNVEHKADTGGNSLEIPNVGHGSGKLDGAHSLAANLCAGYFNTALVAYSALIADSFILSAMAFPVLGGSENPFAEKTVGFGL